MVVSVRPFQFRPPGRGRQQARTLLVAVVDKLLLPSSCCDFFEEADEGKVVKQDPVFPPGVAEDTDAAAPPGFAADPFAAGTFPADTLAFDAFADGSFALDGFAADDFAFDNFAADTFAAACFPADSFELGGFAVVVHFVLAKVTPTLLALVLFNADKGADDEDGAVEDTVEDAAEDTAITGRGAAAEAFCDLPVELEVKVPADGGFDAPAMLLSLLLLVLLQLLPCAGGALGLLLPFC